MNRPLLPILVLLCAAASADALGQGSPTGEPPGPAPAAPAPPSNTEQRYADAQAHYIAERYTEALPIFQALYAESGSPNASLYVARCLREMGQLPEAHEQLVLTERVASERARTEERFAATSETARRELRALDARIGKVTLALPVRPDGLEIEVNGKPLPSERWGTPLAVLPGKVRLWATAPGHATVRQELDVAAGSAVTLTVRLAPEGTEPPAAPAAPSADASPDPRSGDAEAGSSGLLAAGIVTLGIGVVGMGTFAISGLLANQQFAEVEDECGGRRCTDPSHNDAIDTGRTMDTVANVGLVVGLVGLVTGGVLIAVDLATAEPASSPNAPVPTQALWLESLPGGGGLGYRLRF